MKTLLMILNKRYYPLIILLVAFLALWSMYTLQYTPLPWVDEVYFASVTQSFVDGNGLTLPVGLNQDVYHYGPVYFLLTGLSVLIGGFNLFSFRIVGLIFSFFVGYLVYLILNEKRIGKKLAIAIVVIMLYDQLLVYCSHIGRMELVAVTFLLISLFYFEKNKGNYSISSIVLISFNLLLALLTTSRSVVIILPIGIIVLLDLLSKRQWKELFLFVLIPIVGFLIWLFSSYGSFESFVNYYTQVEDSYADGNLVNRFVGGSFIISKNHYPLVILSLLIVIHSVIEKYFKSIGLYVVTILLFYLVVHSTSDTYSVMIFPFYFLIIGIGIKKMIEMKKKRKMIFVLAATLLMLNVFINIVIFFAKWTLIESAKEYRDKDLIKVWISKHIPEGSLVLASDAYYYAMIDNHCNYKSLTQVYRNDNQLRNYLCKDFKPEYVMMYSYEGSPDALKSFKLLNLELIDHYEPIPYYNWLDKIVSFAGLSNQVSYEGDLYKVKSIK